LQFHFIADIYCKPDYNLDIPLDAALWLLLSTSRCVTLWKITLFCSSSSLM